MRLIDADELLGTIFFVEDEEGFMTAVVAKKDIESEATVDALPVVHGRWIKVKPVHYQCSICGVNTGGFTSNYCPNCGAKMDKEEV